MQLGFYENNKSYLKCDLEQNPNKLVFIVNDILKNCPA